MIAIDDTAFRWWCMCELREITKIVCVNVLDVCVIDMKLFVSIYLVDVVTRFN